MEWMLMPLKRYADFNGRSRRKEYWFFTLGVTAVLLLGLMLFVVLEGASGDAASDGGIVEMIGNTGVVVVVFFYLAILVPSIAVQVRRMHDQDKSGWFVLLSLIPYIGGIIIFVFMCLEGTKGPNRFGPDPKNPDAGLSDVFS